MALPPDPWNTPTQYPQSPLRFSGESLISGPAEGGTKRRLPQSIEEIVERLREVRGQARDIALQPGGMFKSATGDYRRAMGGKSSAALGALQTTLEGDPIAGLASAPVGLGAGMLANIGTTALTQGMMAGPPQLKAAGMALRFLVPSAVGYQAQQATARGVQSLTGSAPAAVQGAVDTAAQGGGLFGIGTGLQDLEIPLPFVGSVAIGERAKRRREAAYGREELRKDAGLQLELLQQQSNLNLRNELAYAREMGQIQNQNMLNQIKASAPIIADAQRRELAGAQALMNTQGAIYQRLGRMAGMFQLAERGMSESGATARAMIANSPYNAAIMPAPQISFGN